MPEVCITATGPDDEYISIEQELPGIPRQGEHIVISHEGKILSLNVDRVTWMQMNDAVGPILAQSFIEIECSLIRSGPTTP